MTEITENNGSFIKEFNTIRSCYNDCVAQGKIVQDPAQERGIQALDNLLEQIRERTKIQSMKTQWIKKILCKVIKHNKDPLGVYMYGPVGRGKSLLVRMFFDLAPIAKKKHINFHEFMVDIHDALHVYRQQGMNREKSIPILAKQLVHENNLICFDDFHVTEAADAMILDKLFTHMFDEGLIMAASSSFPPEDLYSNGIQHEQFLPFTELIKKHLSICPILGKTDYRMERLKLHNVYLYPVNPETRAEIDCIFNELTEHDLVEKKTITIKGHLLHIPKASSNVARFTFQQLCGQPKGASDYLALARRFECVILDGLPDFDATQSDLVKRFILMLDAFYEKKVKLVILSDVAPDELYKRGELKNEFSRAITRLKEMQTPEYMDHIHKTV